MIHFFKKILGLFVLVILNSCSEELSQPSIITTVNNDAQFEKLLSCVDSLNISFGYNETKALSIGGGTIAVTASFADQLGATFGAWVGSRVGAAVGVATANPVVGVGGYLAGRKLGGIAGYAAFSYITGEVLAHWSSSGDCSLIGFIDDDPSSLEEEESFVESEEYGIIASPDDVMDLSVGDIHNIILNRLKGNNKSYFDSKGEILVEEVYQDALEIERELFIIDEFTQIPYYNDLVIGICSDFANCAKEKIIYNESDDLYYSKLCNILSSCGVPQSSIDVASRLKNKLLTPVVLSYQQTKDYNMAFEELVASIDIEEEEKEEIATIGSVTIMSTEFWDEDDEE